MNGASAEGTGANTEVVAALSKQLGVDAAVVDRIFHAGVAHAELTNKRRRVGDVQNGDGSNKADKEGLSGETPSQEFEFSQGVSLEQLRVELADFAKERDWDQFHSPRNLALAMVGEVGELCECFQWKGEVPEGLPGWSEKQRAHLGQEISDVLLYLIRLSHKCHIDLPKAAMDKLAVNA
eukprot:CAMPEP_0197701080 /NCGR_PEP_ID=MMETSP1338-20131121/122760_1 /TAXON_ID=43686 ORGANISM="Pelagodinium beii, Strain RCC1491" /NCGR_SAMPLE_ID=MMETSP1338 /ASSEMBLY_ACC=CAM_ASM_000754 /LENGTH=179 /DNA_ID=CAMNT_0043284749 /DNA_START=60 /DNA_END=596 /DNA_ORIENTATION=+